MQFLFHFEEASRKKRTTIFAVINSVLFYNYKTYFYTTSMVKQKLCTENSPNIYDFSQHPVRQNNLE